VRSRRVSRPTKNRIRVITTYRDGGTRTAFTIKRNGDGERDRSSRGAKAREV
jgi:hypothetical protein